MTRTAAWLRRRTLVLSVLRETRIQKCQQVIGYSFNDKGLIREALTPDSSGNQRLAVAGDKAADLHLATQWYGSKGPLTPMQWAHMKADLLCNANLARAGFRLGILDGGKQLYGTPAMATTVEAIIGAVWFDSKGDPAALASVMAKFGLTTHPLLSPPPPPTINTTADKGDIWSDRPLPRRFFNGHHLALLQLLFHHGQYFALDQRAARHSRLSRHEHEGDSPTETLPTGMWSRLKSIIFTPKITVDTASDSVAARPERIQQHHDQEPRPRKSTKVPEQHASAPVPATNKQTDTGHAGSNPDSPPSVRHSVVQSGGGDSPASSCGKPTGWYPGDTEYNRIKWFIRVVETDPGRSPADRKSLLKRLTGHLEVLLKLPDRSLGNISDDCSTDGVYYLTTHSADEPHDKLLATQIALLEPVYITLIRRRRRKEHEERERSFRKRVSAQFLELWRARLKLWLPPDAQAGQLPISSPDEGPNPASSSKTPSSRFPVTPAVDSMESLTSLPPRDHRPQRSDPVLWTTNVAKCKSVDWKHYLSKPPIANEGIMQSEAREL